MYEIKVPLRQIGMVYVHIPFITGKVSYLVMGRLHMFIMLKCFGERLV